MKKSYFSILAIALPAMALAQSAFDAQQITQNDFKGTARFMSMGGAFTALGGDLSTLNQNPAGIGIYRSSEVGATLDINFQNSTSTPNNPSLYANNNSQTKAYCNNFGYIGTINLGGTLRSINFGVTYNRAQSFDRVYRGSMADIGTSLSNYIADFTTSAGYTTDQLGFKDNDAKFDPYWDTKSDWMSILAYNSFVINPVSQNSYQGLYNYSSSIADAAFDVRETGHADDYNLSVGGNVENTVYWGFSLGIVDLKYTRSLLYQESIYDGDVIAPASAATTTNGDAYPQLNARKNISGSGVNLKLGVIVKPINELRIGLAVHTPTWYSLNESYDGWFVYKYEPVSYSATGQAVIDESLINSGDSGTPNDGFSWHLNSPWKLMAGVAGVIANRAIVSLDYEFNGYNAMRVKTPMYYNSYGQGTDFQYDDALNADIKDYFRASNTIRLGVEYRVTPQFSLRAGYNVTTSNVSKGLDNGKGANGIYNEVFTSTLDPSYTLNKTNQNICFGLGYRYKAWYIDAAYVYTHRTSDFHAFTNYSNVIAPQSKITFNNSSLVISTGFKF